jgi:hypothetical protein
MTADHEPRRWTDEEVRALVAEARAEARDEVKATLRAAFARTLAARIEALGAEGLAPAAAPELAPARSSGGPPVPVPVTAPGAPPDTAEAGPAGPARPLWYIYGVVAADLPLTERLEPVRAGGAVTSIEHAGLAAVASPVSEKEYAAEALMRGLNDRAWLERVARDHERVLSSLLHRAVVPFRLCSVFSAPGRVVELLEERGEALREALHRVQGRTELGVKVLVDPAALRRASEGEARRRDLACGEGAAYLAGRRQRRRQEERARELAGEVAAAVHDRLAGMAVDAVRSRPQPRELTGDRRWMALNGAYLVETADRDAFSSEVGRLRARFQRAGIELVLTGPWAPYSFTHIGGETGLEDAG